MLVQRLIVFDPWLGTNLLGDTEQHQLHALLLSKMPWG